MEEQFVLRVPPSVAERLERILSENAASSDDKSLKAGRSGTFVIGPASLLDLPTVVEFYKTYDDSVLINTADIVAFYSKSNCYLTLVLVDRLTTWVEATRQEKHQDDKAGGTTKNPAPASKSKADVLEAPSNAGSQMESLIEVPLMIQFEANSEADISSS